MKHAVLLLSVLLAPSVMLAAAETPRGATVPQSSPYDDGLFTIIEVEKPVYPTRMIVEGVKRGMVVVLIEVDENGRLVDQLPVAYTHKPFADEVTRAVKTWRFAPLREEGRPYSTIAEISVEFHQEGVSVIQKFAETRAYLDTDYVYSPTPADLLDRPPVAIRRVNPTYPEQLREQGRVGHIPVTYFIDEQGRVRMPVASSLEDSFLAGLAVAAVKQWQYEPPTVRGRPVLTKVTTSFIFGESDVAASSRSRTP